MLQTKYNATEVAEMYKISRATVSLRASKLGIKPTTMRSGRIYKFTPEQVYSIANMYKKVVFPDVVKIIETFWIAPSIGNFLTIEQLENYEKNN